MEPVVVTSEKQIRRIVSDALQTTLPQLLSTLKPVTEQGKEWLTEAEARQFLGWSKTTMARRRSDGTLPYSKVNGSLFYRLEDIVAVLEAHLVSGSNDAKG